MQVLAHGDGIRSLFADLLLLPSMLSRALPSNTVAPAPAAAPWSFHPLALIMQLMNEPNASCGAGKLW